MGSRITSTREQDRPVAGLRQAHCIGCGCHDFAACVCEVTGQPCSWLVVDRGAGLGVCSECGDHMGRWANGEREIAVPVGDCREIERRQVSDPR